MIRQYVMDFAAAYAAHQQAWLAEHFRNANYSLTMACVELAVFIAIIILAAIGLKARGIEF